MSEKKKEKKLVFLSRNVLKSVRQEPNTSGTYIAEKILELYKKFERDGNSVEFKNV